MTFKFADIGTITVDTDSEAHVLLICKAGAECIERVQPGAGKTSMNVLAFSIKSMEMGESALRLFQELRARDVRGAESFRAR